MFNKWKTPEYLTRPQSERWRDIRGSRDGQGQTGCSGRTSWNAAWRTWTLHGRKPRNWRQTWQNGISSPVHPTGSGINRTEQNNNKPVGVEISAPSPNFVAMATTVGPEVQWIADFPQAELNYRVREHGWRHGNVALCAQIAPAAITHVP